MGDTNGVIPLSGVRPFRSSSPLSDPQQVPLSEVVREPVDGFDHSEESLRANAIENESSMSISSSSGTAIDEAAGHSVSSDVAAGSGGGSKAVTSGVSYPLAVSTEASIKSTGIISQGDTMQHRQHNQSTGQSTSNIGSASASLASKEGRRVSIDNMASANTMEGVSTAADGNGSRFDSQKVSSGSSNVNQGDAHLASVVSGAVMSSVVSGASPSMAVINTTEGASRASDIAGGGLALQQQSAPQQQSLASKTTTEMRDHRLEEGGGVGARNGISDDFPGGVARDTSPITVVGSTQMEARVVSNDVMAAAGSGVSVASGPERSSEDGGVFEPNGRNIAPRVLPDRSEVSRQGSGDKAPHLTILSRGNGTSRNRPAPAPGQGMGYGMPGGFGPFKFNIPTTAPAAATLNP